MKSDIKNTIDSITDPSDELPYIMDNILQAEESIIKLVKEGHKLNGLNQLNKTQREALREFVQEAYQGLPQIKSHGVRLDKEFRFKDQLLNTMLQKERSNDRSHF